MAKRLAAMDAHDDGTEDGKGEPASQPAHDNGELHELLLCGHLCQTFI